MEEFKTSNIYFPVYKTIENEVLELSSLIHFTDDQINVYSLKIADLILRCSIELESLAKDIYREETKKKQESTGNCFKWLDENLKISKKAIVIISPYFHFDINYKPFFRPFNYEKDSPNDYYKQYNSIKHNRAKSLNKANLNTLIRVLGALYILNIYYKNVTKFLESDYMGNGFDKSGGSDIFNFLVYPCEEASIFINNEGIVLDDCIYKIEKKCGEYCFTIEYRNNYNELKSVHLHYMLLQEFSKQNIGKNISLDELFMEISKFNNLSIEEQKNDIFTKLKIKNILNIKPVKLKDYYCASLNK